MRKETVYIKRDDGNIAYKVDYVYDGDKVKDYNVKVYTSTNPNGVACPQTLESLAVFASTGLKTGYTVINKSQFNNLISKFM